MKQISAKTGVIYFIPEKLLKEYENGEVEFVDGDKILDLRVDNRAGEGFNVILNKGHISKTKI
jgi:hypothetical protein